MMFRTQYFVEHCVVYVCTRISYRSDSLCMDKTISQLIMVSILFFLTIGILTICIPTLTIWTATNAAHTDKRTVNSFQQMLSFISTCSIILTGIKQCHSTWRIKRLSLDATSSSDKVVHCGLAGAPGSALYSSSAPGNILQAEYELKLF